MDIQDNRQLIRSPLSLLAMGLLLLLSYFVMSLALDTFVDPILYYYHPGNMREFGAIGSWRARDFSQPRLLSIAFKVLLLMPATICLALFLAIKVSEEQSRRLLDGLRSIRPLPALVTICIALAAAQAFCAAFIFNGQPIYDDIRLYTYQAGIIRHGSLIAPVPVGFECLEDRGTFLVGDGRTTMITFGHPLLLAVGMMLGSAYVLPILLMSLTPIFVFLIGRKQFGERVGLLAAALLLVSPAFLFTGATLMNHGTMFFCLTLFMWAYLKSKPGAQMLFPIIAGLALGYGFAIRPQSAVAFGVPFAIWSLAKLMGRDWRRELTPALAMLAAFAVPFACLLVQNHIITGDWLQLPQAAVRSQNGSHYGFGEIGGRYQHTSLLAAVHLLINGVRMNSSLFGWPVSLLFVLLFVARGRFVVADRIHGAIVAGFVVVYACYPGPGVEEIGARYYFPLLLPLALWTARGMIDLHEWFTRQSFKRLRGGFVVPAFVGLSVMFAGLTFYAESALHYMSLTEKIALPFRTVERAGIRNAIVSIDRMPLAGWVFTVPYNSADLSDDVIYVRSGRPGAILEMMNAMPGRRVFSMAYDSKAPGGGRVNIQPWPREAIEEAARRRAEEELNETPKQ